MTARIFRRPAFLEAGDAFCDSAMRALPCGGRPPAGLSARHLSWRLGAADFQAARIAHADSPAPAIKRLTAAARHAAMIRELRQGRIDLLYVWRGLAGRAALAAQAARALNLPCLFFERGPLPGWLQIDPKGINARNSVPREARFFQRWQATRPGLDLTAWRSLRGDLSAREPLRDLVAQNPRADWSGEGPFLFCPFQQNASGDPLPDGGWVSDPADLMAALARASHALPPGWHLRVKPHPNARGDLARLAARHPKARLLIDRDTNSLDQLAASRGVITVNSAMGIEAFFFDKPVITLGDSYFGGLGRTDHADGLPALTALLTAPDRLSFDQPARDLLMSFLFTDYLTRDDDLRAGRIDAGEIFTRQARHQALDRANR
ncbi:MAG: hypothetical protein ACK5IP_01930 [Paracoccus sp. (in: a-proteobacteria)]